MAQEAGRARLRGRHRRAHLVRRICARLRADDRQAARLRPAADASAQPPDDGDGRITALGRLVGFNAGSALAANGLAASASTPTNTGAAAAGPAPPLTASMSP